ncbi:hypothetical protein TUM4438_46560 [Shewanella sairae]|uniref:Uncharacterized protein n=1 Tax=Shewanella sairae TaxID=190310 RepID=A0ABQ4PS39_9GAMM|nr:hypothetical protein [Shewanella sairae]GIU52940.1 hypothetical protein TUM4438_46560 [Shewanella sairae]
MTATVYVVEKNERDLLIFHQKTCWYAGDRIVGARASYTAEAAFKVLSLSYLELAPCRECCAGLAKGFYAVAFYPVPIAFNLEDWLQKRKQCE